MSNAAKRYASMKRWWTAFVFFTFLLPISAIATLFLMPKDVSVTDGLRVVEYLAFLFFGMIFAFAATFRQMKLFVQEPKTSSDYILEAVAKLLTMRIAMRWQPGTVEYVVETLRRASRDDGHTISSSKMCNLCIMLAVPSSPVDDSNAMVLLSFLERMGDQKCADRLEGLLDNDTVRSRSAAVRDSIKGCISVLRGHPKQIKA